jgi:hypothetical protein
MKGYPTQTGYMGYIPNKGYSLFATETDYEEYYQEYVMEENGNGRNH